MTDPLAARILAVRAARIPADPSLASALDAAWCGLHPQGTDRQSADAIVKAARAGADNGKRWWCVCGAYASRGVDCKKCRASSAGHVFQEDSPVGGNTDRRARLRARQRARRLVR